MVQNWKDRRKITQALDGRGSNEDLHFIHVGMQLPPLICMVHTVSVRGKDWCKGHNILYLVVVINLVSNTFLVVCEPSYDLKRHQTPG